eukprot:TRINITY_DN7174_c0_g1_i15.p1 TRINITY_DN7174_c0_g1~~TRINITY_DN7174_c0_g1_i15.p1  ORF type:complete len:289 (+),score=67.25 TRINITY_DN7174_c0_g1_i15:170-1036(+)
MIPFEFEAPVLKTLCLKYLRTLKSRHPYFMQFTTQNFPLECIVCATTPHFVISDCHNSIVCQFTKSCLLDFKRAYYYYKVRTLKGKYVAIRGYFPHCAVENTAIAELYLVVTEFEIIRGANISYAPAPSAPPIAEVHEIKEMMAEVQAHSYRLAIRPSEEEMSDVEEKEDPEALEAVKPEEASAALQKLVDEGVGDMLESEDEIVNYENIDEEECIAEERAKKMKYEDSEDSEESLNPSNQLKDELVKLMESSPDDCYTSKLLVDAANLSIPSDFYKSKEPEQKGMEA